MWAISKVVFRYRKPWFEPWTQERPVLASFQNVWACSKRARWWLIRLWQRKPLKHWLVSEFIPARALFADHFDLFRNHTTTCDSTLPYLNCPVSSMLLLVQEDTSSWTAVAAMWVVASEGWQSQLITRKVEKEKWPNDQPECRIIESQRALNQHATLEVGSTS